MDPVHWPSEVKIERILASALAGLLEGGQRRVVWVFFSNLELEINVVLPLA